MKKNGFKTNDIFTRKDLNTDGGELHMFDSCSWLGLSSDPVHPRIEPMQPTHSTLPVAP